jgi:PhzF family phenazine biosynthesis protein
MQNIAIENNLSETAFIVKNGNNYDLRWFMPGGEIDLCGHATLGSAFIIMKFYDKNINEIFFNTKSGILTVKKGASLYEMDFPAYNLKPVGISEQMKKAIGFKPVEAWMARDLVCVLENEDLVCQAKINMAEAIELEGLLLHITAKGIEFDCVSRTFAPKLGVNEDPVCGSGHCHIVPLWSQKLTQKTIVARQASKRGGTLYCENNGDRVKISGKAKLYLEGELRIK